MPGINSIPSLRWQNYTNDAKSLIAPLDLDFTTYDRYDVTPRGFFQQSGDMFAAGVVIDNLLNGKPVIVEIGALRETVVPFTKQVIALQSGSQLVRISGSGIILRVSFFYGPYVGTSAATNFYAAQQQATSAVQTGMIYMFAGNTATIPVGYLLCDGAQVSRRDQAALFQVIGTTYGAGDGSTTFNLPLLSGGFPIGAGSAGGRTPRTLGTMGGAERVTLSVSEMPQHGHPISDPGHTHSISQSGHAHGVSDGGHGHQMFSYDANGNGRMTFGQAGIAYNLQGAGAYNQGGAAGFVGKWFAYNGTESERGWVGVNAGTANIGIGAQNANVSNLNSATGISVQTNGGNGSHDNMPPWTAVNFVIKT